MFVLKCLVGGVWTPVLTQSEDCPTPIPVTVSGLHLWQRRDWIAKYAAMNNVSIDVLQFVHA